ncbi:MAG: T9SS type A sorting domain-containing protein [Bacteroidota bacterium]
MLLFVVFPLIIHAQQNFRDPKQSNISGSDIIADTPWRIKKTDSIGNVNGIPLHIFIKDANDIGFNAELISLNIFIKNANDTSFGNPIVFDTYNDSAFLALFSAKSQYDPDLDIQSFDAGLPVKNSNYTISFTIDTCVWPDNCTYVDITHAFWYFTIIIPPEKLAGLEDIIDIRVDFSLNWQTDESTYLRVFRYDYDLPQLPGWYRGDAHYHTMYTNNTAEYGLPLASTKEAAKAIGISWIASTNHSCDYDNYGVSITDNWNKEKTEIQNLNAQDTSMIFIHAEEVSVNNSAGNLVHMLCYPSDSLPYSLSYLGDGDGDVTATSLNIDEILYPLSEIGGFAYTPHPFAGGDKLSAFVDGDIWNVGDAGFYANGTAVPGNDVVICNDLSVPSDLYSQNTGQFLFKKEIKGGEIWNCRNAIATTGEAENPWNAEYDPGIDPFSAYDTANTSWHWNRLLQNMEVIKFLNKKGLTEKNNNPSLSSYRFYFTAGSDAHGSFNYSNTDFVMGMVADIHDNALGRPATVTYCPSGMGTQGENVLKALQNGNTVMSDGPLITAGIDLNNDGQDDFICGDEVLPDVWQYVDAKIHIQIANIPEYGNIEKGKLVFGTQNSEHIFMLNVTPGTLNENISLSLDSLVTQMEQYDTIQDWEYFYVRAELQTHKNFDSLSIIYRDTAQDYHAITNPLWVKKPAVIASNHDIEFDPEIKYYPNPFTDELTVFLNLKKSADITCEIFDITGRLVYKAVPQSFPEGEHLMKIITENLSQGIYSLHLSINNFRKISKHTKIYGR